MNLAGKSAVAEVLEAVQEVKKLASDVSEEQKIQRREIAEFKEKHATAVYPKGMTPGGPYGISGGIPSDSDGYSVMRIAGYMSGIVDKEKVKYELDIHEKLKSSYDGHGWRPTPNQNGRSVVIPFDTRCLPTSNSVEERTVAELKCKMVANAGDVDPLEAQWIQRKMGMRQKDLTTVDETTGGVLVGFPTLMELVDIQRNIEAFSRAGATETGLPANGRMQYPKLTNVTTAFWVGEAATITESTPATGYLDLQAKKLGILVDLNNELIRFGSITAEAMVRGDMAKVAALKADLAMLEGTGGTQIKGIINYPSAASWTTGTDTLLAYTVTSNTIQISDAAEMEAVMPDTAGEPTAWIMRRQLWAKVRNRRAAAFSTVDNQGPYLASTWRSLQERQRYEWDGTPVIRSTQVSATRGSGSQTYALLGYFPDWIIGRFGVLEFLSSNVGDTQMTADQTRLRCIQHIDAGARHASSFVFADAITIQ